MTATAGDPRRTAGPAGTAPADAWAQRQLQAEWLLDHFVGSAREAAARVAARAREEAEDMWAEAAQHHHNGSASG
jgi:hypothetical protein